MGISRQKGQSEGASGRENKIKTELGLQEVSIHLPKIRSKFGSEFPSNQSEKRKVIKGMNRVCIQSLLVTKDKHSFSRHCGHFCRQTL